MSAVHDKIAEMAYGTLAAAAQEKLRPHLAALYLSSGYPDLFADRSRRAETAARIDPDAIRFLWPDPPAEPWYQRVLDATANEDRMGMAPLRFGAHLPEYYLRQSLAALRAHDDLGATKFFGVYSHVIGDTAEPVHAVHPHVLDFVVPPPAEFIAFELHAGIEMLCAPVNIAGYAPRLLGRNIEQAAMGAIAGLYRARDVGAGVAAAITQAIYAGDRDRALALSSQAQNESARQFADFMHTVFWLFQNGATAEAGSLDLTDYPWAAADVDMLYRYRPTRNVSLVPYAGTARPLALPGSNGGKSVTGLGVLPFLGPPYVADTVRQTRVEYFLVPGAYSAFCVRVGVNPLFADSAGGVVFTVSLDGNERFRSPSLTRESPPVTVNVPLGNARWLTLATRYAPNANREQMDRAKDHLGWASHAVWAEPRLISE